LPTLLLRLAAHWPLKLASLGMALLLWVLVSAEEVTTQWITIPMEARVQDPGLVLSERAPETVRVQVTGPGRLLWQLALSPPTLVLPVRQERAAGYALEPEMIRIPHGLRRVTVRDIHPAVLRLDVQRMETREVPVRPRFSRASLDDFLIRGTPEVSPESVRVTGPSREVSRLRFVPTRPIELDSEDSSSFSTRVALDTADLSAFTLSPPTVRVSGSVDVHGRRSLTDVAIRSGDGSVVGVADLRIDGPARVLAQLDPARVMVEETGAGLRVAGLPASAQAEVVARRAIAAPAADSAGAPR